MHGINKLSLILTVNLIILAVLFVVSEGVFRILHIPYDIKYIPDENTFARFDPELGWSYVSNISTLHKSDDIITTVHFDENGIRVSNPDVKLDYSRPSVLFVGCSFTMGHGLSYEESFVGKFEPLVNADYQVVNLGVQGYGTDQTLLALKKYITRFNAKVVVYTFIEDHIIRNGNYDRRMLIPTARFLGTKPIFSLDSERNPYLSHKPLLYKDYIHSYLFDFMKMRIGTKLGTFPPFPEELTKKLILEMKEYAQGHGAHFVVLNWRWSDDEYGRLFQELDINYIDTMENAPSGWEKMVLLEGIHPDAEASDHVAQLLLKYFQSKKLLF